MPENAEAGSKPDLDESRRWKNLLQLFLQLFHLALAAAILLSGLVEFSAEPTIFDVFGNRRSAIPREAFKVRLWGV